MTSVARTWSMSPLLHRAERTVVAIRHSTVGGVIEELAEVVTAC